MFIYNTTQLTYIIIYCVVMLLLHLSYLYYSNNYLIQLIQYKIKFK